MKTKRIASTVSRRYSSSGFRRITRYGVGSEPSRHRQQAVGSAAQQRNQQDDQKILQEEHADHEPPERLEQLASLLEEAHHDQG
jgi:hypothetical protein